MTVADLPLVNAAINVAVAILLIAGYLLIRRGNRRAHERVMISAIVLSALFLASYLTYHFLHGATKYTGVGILRPIYFTILITHTVLAVVNLPFVIMTFARGLKRNFPAHRKIAKRTWAIWLYVAITGPIVYAMLRASYTAPSAFAEARALHRQQKEKEALAKYREAGDHASQCYAAVLADRLEGTDTSSATIASVLREEPNNPHCLTMKARALIYDDREKEAVAILEQVVRAEPSDAFFWGSLGFALFRSTRYPEAAAAFEKSIALDPELAANVYNAGYAWFLEGEWKKAKPLIERALALGLEPELGDRARTDLDVINGKRWVCPMHPDEVGKPGEVCSICGMKLEVSPRALSSSADG